MKFDLEVQREIVKVVLSVELYPSLRPIVLDYVRRGLAGLLPQQKTDHDQIWSDVTELCKDVDSSDGPPMVRFLQAVVELRSHRPETQRLLAILKAHGLDPEASVAAERPQRTMRPDLSALQYARMHRDARQRVQSLRVLAKRLELQSFEQRAEALLDALRAELYRVTITGKSRAGKSTLLNRLIDREVCPAKRVLTTAVPIVIGPGEEEWIRVDFIKGQSHRLDGPVTADMLRPYADHGVNPDNIKGVESIDVRLAGSVLDLGVEYIDVPGIDDPSAPVWQRAQEVVDEAHALVVVIDVAPFATGGLTVDRQVRSLLEGACARGAAVFVVGNKADVLDLEARDEVRALLRTQLRAMGLPADTLPGPYIISASRGAADEDECGDLAGDYVRFDDELWQHLWRNHDIGLRRLLAILSHLRLAAEELAVIFAVRDSSEAERVALREALDSCASEKKRVLAQVDEAVARHVEVLGDRVQALGDEFAERAAALIRDDCNSPDLKTVQAHLGPELQERLLAVGEAVKSDLQTDLVPLCLRADGILSDLRGRIGIPGEGRGLPASLSDLDVKLNDLSGTLGESVRRWLGRGVIATGVSVGGLLLFSNPVTAGVVALVATFSLSVAEAIGRTPPSRDVMAQRARQAIATSLERAKSDMSRQLQAEIRAFKQKLNRHMAPFLSDMDQRLRELEPPSDEERALHRQIQDGVDQILESLIATLEGGHSGDAEGSTPSGGVA